MPAYRMHKTVSKGFELAIEKLGGPTEMAKSLGVDYSVVSRYRTGHIKLPPKHAYKIHILTKIPFISLFKDEISESIKEEYNQKLDELSKKIHRKRSSRFDSYIDKIINWAIVIGSSL